MSDERYGGEDGSSAGQDARETQDAAAREPEEREPAVDLERPPLFGSAPDLEPVSEDEADRARESFPDPELLAPGTMIAGRFRIERLIGRGGHGFVYEADHVVLGYPVAIKVLHAAFGLDARRRARFRREALLGARLRHRNVVSIHDAGELSDGSPFLVMEHVDGVDLATVIDRARLDAATTIDIGEQLLAAVTALTERGVIHRDIKPNNVMLQRAVDGFVEVKLLDFGISKAMRAELALKTLTADDCVLGTPQYMSPEQVRGEVLDVRADLYAVGCLLYECMTGVPPFDAETPGAVLAKILTEDAPPVRMLRADVPDELADVIDRAVEKRPDDRWRSPAEMSEALRAAAQRLALPRGADAWARVSFDVQAPCDPEDALVLDVAPARLSPPEPVRVAETAQARPLSRPRRPSPSTPAVGVVPPWPSRRLALVAVVPIAIGLAAASWAWDGGEEVRASSDGVESGGALVRVGAPKPDEDDADDVGPRLAWGARNVEAPEGIARGVDVPAEPQLEPRGRHGGSRARGPVADPADLERRALSAYLAGRDREAMSVYLRATELAPERPSAWRGLGLAAVTAGDEPTAARALRRYLTLEPRARDRDAIERRIAWLGRVD